MPAPSPAPISFDELRAGAQLLGRLPGFLRQPIRLADARTILRQRLERRETDFLALVKRAIYAHAASPYLPLLGMAGCEYEDLEKLVTRDGVEGALQTLFRQGVFLSVDEFKGRRPIVRHGAIHTVDPGRFRNPLAASHVPGQSGGSRGTGTPMMFDLALLRDLGIDVLLALEARGGTRWWHADWGVPGSVTMANLLLFSACGARPARWFSQVDPRLPGLHPRYRWSARALRWGNWLAGAPLPRPQFVPLADPLPIATWMADVLRGGHTPHLITFASSAIRVCQAAERAGLGLHGAQFTLGGEPVTQPRLAAIRQAGVEAVSWYGSSETTTIGLWCLATDEPDDVHLLQDFHALIQPGPDAAAAGLPSSLLLLSSLRPTAPCILLNVSLGDRAIVQHRSCGCPEPREAHRWRDDVPGFGSRSRA